MSSAFKNFFITFIVCLVLFCFFGFQYAYPWLNEMVDFTDMGPDVSEDVSNEVSSENSNETSAPVVPPSTIDPSGDVFTAAIMCVDSHGRVLNSVFIDANGKSKQFIYCTINPTTKAKNEVGVAVPIGDLFSNMSPDAISKCMTAMTGIETQYCLIFNRDDIKAIAAMIPGAYVVLNEDIVFVNPEYSDYIPVLGVPFPDDYYITISNVDGKVLLNERVNGKTKLEWLLTYNPNTDGTEYNAIYSRIAKALIRQFFNQENSMMSSEVMAKIIRNCETNLTTDDATNHLETIFSYNDYTLHELVYPTSWELAVVRLRELDGSYNIN